MRFRGTLKMGLVLSGALSLSLICVIRAQSDSATSKQPAGEVSSHKKLKTVKETVWNLDGGIFFATDGSLASGACFRVSGNAIAPDFFTDLKRIDDEDGTRFVRGKETIVEFPRELSIRLRISDTPCSLKVGETTDAPVLTQESISTLRLKLFWKSGVALRPAMGLEPHVLIEPVAPYSTTARDLPQRYAWTYTFSVRCEGVPLTDSLVFIIETPDGRVAARVAARL
jgi:hypothetical protein